MTTLRYQLSSRTEPITVEDYRARAHRALPDMIWAYIDHGSETESTLAANRNAFARYALRQRVLVGSRPRDLRVGVAGRQLSLPIMLAPTGLTGLTHWTGELGAAQAAERAGTVSIVSTASTYSFEEVAEGTEKANFFQLYPCADDSGIENITLRLMERAEDRGYEAMFVTVDVPALGNREVERKRGMGNPPVLTPARVLQAATRPRWCYNFFKHQRVSARNLTASGGARAAMTSIAKHARIINPELNWDHLSWMRDRWKGRFFVKGLLDAEDASRAVALGADGVVVSNHGGRQLDYAAATLDALPAVVEAVGSRAQVVLDGGVRRGSDVVKALCLGADAVCIGRPYLYGLAADGPAGVERILKIFREEIMRTLTLMGITDLSQLDASWLLPAAGMVPATGRPHPSGGPVGDPSGGAPNLLQANPTRPKISGCFESTPVVGEHRPERR